MKVSCLRMVTCAETSAEVEEGWGEWVSGSYLVMERNG